MRVVNDATFVDADPAQCTKATRELYSMSLESEAAVIVRSLTGLDGVEAWSKLHANNSRRALRRVFRVQRDCMYPKAAKDVSQVKASIMQCEDKLKNMMTELGGDAEIPDLWRLSLEMWLKM